MTRIRLTLLPAGHSLSLALSQAVATALANAVPAVPMVEASHAVAQAALAAAQAAQAATAAAKATADSEWTNVCHVFHRPVH
jgi:hypothetical protein